LLADFHTLSAQCLSNAELSNGINPKARSAACSRRREELRLWGYKIWTCRFPPTFRRAVADGEIHMLRRCD